MPLVHFLKQYFAQHKKHGSKDRKLISHACYCYYRIGHILKESAIEERLKIAMFLCNDVAGEWSILFDESWIQHWNIEIEERIHFVQTVYPAFSINSIFPWTDQLSDGIELKDFITSHLIQPDLFLRIRPGNEKAVLQKLSDKEIPFKQLSSNCLALPNSSKIDTILQIDKEVVIQDYSSQKTGELLSQARFDGNSIRAWDCCAASGGKSILAFDVLQNIELTVSDIRPSILHNLKQRFERAGIKKYHSEIRDLSNSQLPPEYSGPNFQLILCDAPCTSSGTWSRTPEQLCFFTEEKIDEYALLQKKITGNIIRSLEEGGYLLYITCSVFRKENEEAVAFICGHAEMELVKMELLKGHDKKADTMFAALFVKRTR
jgi:16S rRNA (cytosine967-C5)-methyltransferase